MTSKMGSANGAKNDIVFSKPPQVWLPVMFAAPTTDMGLSMIQSNGMQPFNGQQQSKGELTQAPSQQHHDHQSCHQMLHEQQALLHKQHEQLSDLQKRLDKSEKQLKHIREQLRQNKGRGESKGNNNWLSRLRQSTPPQSPRPQLLPLQEQQPRQNLEGERQNKGTGQGQGNNISQSIQRDNPQSTSHGNHPHSNPHNLQQSLLLPQKQPPPSQPLPKPVGQRLPTAISQLLPPRDVHPQGISQAGNKKELLTIHMVNDGKSLEEIP